jgi:hypothetical protein
VGVVPIDAHRAASQIWVRANVESERRRREGTGQQIGRERSTDGTHPEIFPSTRYFPAKNRKSLPKTLTKVRSQFVIGSVDPVLLTSSRSLLANKRHAGSKTNVRSVPEVAGKIIAC